MKILIFTLLAVLLYSCEKSEYETYLTIPGTEAIDSVAIYPNSPSLIADGKAQLTFMVKAFSKVEVKRTIEQVINGKHVVKDSVYTKLADMKIDRIPADQIHITTADGQPVVNNTFSTTEGAGEEREFVCSINGIKSLPCRVKLVARPELDVTLVTIPVVFHLLCTDENKAGFDGIGSELLQGFLDRANQVFSGNYATDPMAVDCKIRFKMATEDAEGNSLTVPGINKVELGDPAYGEVKKYITENLMWDPDKILNIWVNDELYGNNAEGPSYILDNGTVLPGFDLTVVHSPEEAEFSDYSSAGIALSVNSVFSLNKAGSGNSDHLEYYLGTYLGLLPTVFSEYSGIPFVDGDVDYCSDTYTYELGPISREKSTYSTDPAAPVIYFNSFNIMDASSASTSLTYEQALRIRKVIANCPGRMFR